MPSYCFRCKKCDNTFEIECMMSEISDKKPKCPSCNSVRCKRDWKAENPNFFPPNKTLGSQADKNSANFSSDYQNYLLNKGREDWDKQAERRYEEKGIETMRDTE